mgnify:CR=1 FL=1
MPHARLTDPHTSHEAALTVNNLSKVQEYILAILVEPLTDEQLVERYTDLMKAHPLFVPRASQSGIRTRRSELADKDLVKIVGHASTYSGRRAHLWQKVEAQ